MEQIKNGDYVKGFKFDEDKYPKYIPSMDVRIDTIGIVIGCDVEANLVALKFSDEEICFYPLNQAIRHLCTQDMIDFEKGLDANAKDCLEETPFHKPDFSHLRERIEKGVDIRFESKSVNDLKLESLKRNQQENLFSVYLSLGKVRIIYIDQTEEDVRTHQKNNPNWNIIVVKQEQDKGIQIVIKE